MKFEHKRGLGVRACAASCVFMLISSAMLMALLVTGDFSAEYVYRNTERSLPLIYKISAFWSGSAGSLMLWASFTSAVFLIICAVRRRKERARRGLVSCLAATTAVLQLGFLTALVFINNPFAHVGANSDGFGLTPSLQSMGMVIHPPLIMISYSLVFAAFAAGAAELLREGKEEDGLSGRLALLAWLVLTVGIVSGGIWAYTELGWGGYWSWDAIENSAFVSWLLLTAYLHTDVFRPGAGRAPRARFALIAVTAFSLLFGTFIARSGILESVHSYSNQKIRIFFMVFLAMSAVCAAVLLLAARRRKGASVKPALVSHVAILILCAAVVEVMTLLPLFGIDGLKAEQGTYDIVFGALGTAVLVLSSAYYLFHGAGWKRGMIAAAVSAAVGAAAALLPGFRGVPVHTRILLAVNTACIAAMCISFVLNTDRYLDSGRSFAGFTLHLAPLIVAIGLLGSRGMRIEQSCILRQGETAAIGGHSITYTDFEHTDTPEKTVWTAVLEYDGTGGRRELRPSMELFKKKDIYASRACIVPLMREDFYVLTEDVEDGGTVLLKILVSKWVSFLWAGIALMVLSALFLYCDVKYREKRYKKYGR